MAEQAGDDREDILRFATLDERREWASLREQAATLDLQRQLLTDRINRLRQRLCQRRLAAERRIEA